MLNKQQILEYLDLETKRVEAFGGTVYVRSMSAGDRDRFEAEHLKDPDANIRARLVVYTACDADGNLLFTSDDLQALSKKSAKEVDKVFSVAVKLNGISANDVDELEKNS